MPKSNCYIWKCKKRICWKTSQILDGSHVSTHIKHSHESDCLLKNTAALELTEVGTMKKHIRCIQPIRICSALAQNDHRTQDKQPTRALNVSGRDLLFWSWISVFVGALTNMRWSDQHQYVQEHSFACVLAVVQNSLETTQTPGVKPLFDYVLHGYF